MKKIIILLAIFVMGCNNKPPMEKPFIITFKFPESALCIGGCCRYEYTDANGNTQTFCEDEKLYSIGDTIH